jgi:hypothetical protein
MGITSPPKRAQELRTPILHAGEGRSDRLLRGARRSVRVEFGLLVEEFRRLEELRRQRGLSMPEALRYRSLFETLEERLSPSGSPVEPGSRRHLRVGVELLLTVRTATAEHQLKTINIGGGGCAVQPSAQLRFGELVDIDGAVLDGHQFPLTLRAQVVRDPLTSADVGLRFLSPSAEAHAEIETLVYHALERFAAGAPRPSAPPSAEPPR